MAKKRRARSLASSSETRRGTAEVLDRPCRFTTLAARSVDRVARAEVTESDDEAGLAVEDHNEIADAVGAPSPEIEPRLPHRLRILATVRDGRSVPVDEGAAHGGGVGGDLSGGWP